MLKKHFSFILGASFEIRTFDDKVKMEEFVKTPNYANQKILCFGVSVQESTINQGYEYTLHANTS